MSEEGGDSQMLPLPEIPWYAGGAPWGFMLIGA